MKINKISNISPLIYKTTSKTNVKDKNIHEYSYSNIPFEGFGVIKSLINSIKIFEEQYAKDFLNKKGRPSTKECLDVIKNHPLTLVEAQKLLNEATHVGLIKVPLYQSPSLTAKASKAIKEYFDNKFDSYRIISVGTSPAFIAEAMEHLGCECIYLPASNVRSLSMSDVEAEIFHRTKVSDMKNPKILTEYFKSKVPPDDNKINIVMDYCCSGKSLKIITDLLKEKSGLNPDNFKECSLGDLLDEILAKTSLFSAKDVKKIKADCSCQMVEYISSVPHFDMNDKINELWIKKGEKSYISSKDKSFNDVFKEFENYSTKLSRAYSLCVFAQLNKNLIKGKNK